MSTNHWQAKLPGDVFWTNVPHDIVENLRACGYVVRDPGAANQAQEEVAA